MKKPLILSANDFEFYSRDKFWREFAANICRKHGISFQKLERAQEGDHIVFFVDDLFVIKIFNPFDRSFWREKTALLFSVGKTSLALPEILFEGDLENFKYLIFTQIKGISLDRKFWLALDKSIQIEILSQLAVGLKELHSHDAGAIDFDWQKFIERQSKTVLERQKLADAAQKWLDRLPFFLEENLKFLPKVFSPAFLHGDVHFGNLRFIQTEGKWRISGLFDFADSIKGLPTYEFVAIGVLMIQGQGDLQREFFRAYGYSDSEIKEDFRRQLMLLTILYECSDLRKYALRLKPEAINFSLDELERAIWNFV